MLLVYWFLKSLLPWLDVLKHTHTHLEDFFLVLIYGSIDLQHTSPSLPEAGIFQSLLFTYNMHKSFNFRIGSLVYL